MKHTFDRHASMVLDPLRTIPLARAITRVVQKGDIVIDIGAGIGVLSLLALRAGAKQVFAIDADGESLSVAFELAKYHGMLERITFIEGMSQEVDLDIKADVVISETIGSTAFDENILASLYDAKKHLAKRDARYIPEVVELWGAALDDRVKKRTRTPHLSQGSWSDVAGLDLSLGSTARRTSPPTKKSGANIIPAHSLLSIPQLFSRVAFAKPFATGIRVKTTLSATRNAKLGGIALWPRVIWARGCVTDASPLKPATHWGQSFFPLRTTSMKRGERRDVELIIRPDRGTSLQQTEILWKMISKRSGDFRS